MGIRDSLHMHSSYVSALVFPWAYLEVPNEARGAACLVEVVMGVYAPGPGPSLMGMKLERPPEDTCLDCSEGGTGARVSHMEVALNRETGRADSNGSPTCLFAVAVEELLVVLVSGMGDGHVYVLEWCIGS